MHQKQYKFHFPPQSHLCFVAPKSLKHPGENLSRLSPKTAHRQLRENKKLNQAKKAI